MKILIFGASGMLGHRLMLQLSKYHEVYGTVRSENFILPSIDADHIIPMIHCSLWGCIGEALHKASPDVVINCTAAIPQRKNNLEEMMMVNSSFPHRLSAVCADAGVRLIHFSTDAVFSGKRGNYTEDDEPDGNDTYALTKRLGEISDQSHVLTLRCCPIGRELNGAHSLVEWFLAQTGEVKGYTRVYFSPMTTHDIARVLDEYIFLYPELHGVYHLGGEIFTKERMLAYLKVAYGKKDIEIISDDQKDIDRTLSSKRIIERIGDYRTSMALSLHEMIADNTLYEKVAI